MDGAPGRHAAPLVEQELTLGPELVMACTLARAIPRNREPVKTVFVVVLSPFYLIFKYFVSKNYFLNCAYQFEIKVFFTTPVSASLIFYLQILFWYCCSLNCVACHLGIILCHLLA